jgi:hypothetical protein
MAAQQHDHEIAAIRRRLVELGEERRALEARLDQLRRPAADAAPASPTAPERGGVTAVSPAAAKVALFRELFAGRTDVFPVRWENAKAGRAGYVGAALERCATEAAGWSGRSGAKLYRGMAFLGSCGTSRGRRGCSRWSSTDGFATPAMSRG